MNLRLGTVLIAAALALALLAPNASAKITVLDENGGRVDTFSKGKCIVTGKKGKQDFFGTAKSDAGKFSLSVFIDAPVFEGFKEDYIVYYGGEDPQVFLRRRADEAVFSNFAIPGTPPGLVGGGGVSFSKNGKQVGVGLSPASNKSFTEGYSFAGVMSCKYPKRK